MDDAAALDALRTATDLMVEVVGQASGDASWEANWEAMVPACPGWDLTTLVDHLGRVHLWAEHAARTGAPPHPYPSRDLALPLADWYAACAQTLTTTLAALPPDQPAWSFSPVSEHHRAGFWRRRQFHETTVHRVDALQALGRLPVGPVVDAVPGLTAAQAADGVAEVFEVMAPRTLVRLHDRPATELVPASRPIGLACTDTNDAWTVQLVDGAVTVVSGVTAAAVAQVSASAVHLYLALWGRADHHALAVSGDEAAGRALVAASLVP
jgi:uncharacterized protein (TIGR03083 family)